MLYLDRLASNVLKPSQNTRIISIFRQHAAIHWQFGSSEQDRIRGFGANSERSKAVC
jgi:hypothetical protein